jgi:hypothetical protein
VLENILSRPEVKRKQCGGEVYKGGEANTNLLDFTEVSMENWNLF